MADSFLLQEILDFILQEDGISKIILDEVAGTTLIPRMMLMGVS